MQNTCTTIPSLTCFNPKSWANQAMRKSELIEKMTVKQDSLSHSDMTLCVNHILDYLAEALSKKGRIEIRGFGNLAIYYQSSREAQNPKTNEKIVVPGKYKVRFKMGKILKERLNS